MNTDSKQKIQNIFNDTITQIIEVTKKSITISVTNSAPVTNNKPNTAIPGVIQQVTEKAASEQTTTTSNHSINIDAELPNELIPVLQTFMMNIQIYHTQVFNGIINGVSAQVPAQSLLTVDIQQPSVTNRWTGDSLVNMNPGTSNSSMSGFVDINDTDPIWPMQRERESDYRPAQPPSYSVASRETRQHWGSRPDTYSSHEVSFTPSSYSQTHDNYDDFLKYYTTQYDKYNNTYVQDSSSDEENEETWTSLHEYTSSMQQPSNTQISDHTSTTTTTTTIIADATKTNEPYSNNGTGMQCCARLNKYMKYHIIDYPEDFLDSYPSDVYIENGHVFGKPCINLVSAEMEEAGIYFCDEHKYDVEIEDIRQPRQSSTKHNNDGVEIEFRNDGYSAGGLDYYSNSGNTNSDSFSHGIQCCARLNKFRKYRLNVEPTSFLHTYPNDVYIDVDGYIYGSACLNLISDDSAKAGIKYCIEHQSDPYVENICEPSGTLNCPTATKYKSDSDSDSDINSIGHRNNNLLEEAACLGLNEHKF